MASPSQRDQRKQWIRMLETGEKLSPNISAHVKKIDATTVVKFSKEVSLAEAQTMRFVKEHTKIPVPDILDAWTDDDTKITYIVMRFIESENLEEAWPKLDPTQRDKLKNQLRSTFDELRSLKGSYVGRIGGDGGEESCLDQWFDDCDDPPGPFQSHAEFLESLREVIREKGDTSWHHLVDSFIEQVTLSSSSSSQESVLTHGDLQAQNMLIRDGQLVGLIDWEMAGYYPAYWEYIKVHFWSDFKSCWIKDGIAPAALDSHPLELGLLLHARELIW